MVVPFAKKYIFFDFDMKKSVYLFAPLHWIVLYKVFNFCVDQKSKMAAGTT
jgi:hypothetical protein